MLTLETPPPSCALCKNIKKLNKKWIILAFFPADAWMNNIVTKNTNSKEDIVFKYHFAQSQFVVSKERE